MKMNTIFSIKRKINDIKLLTAYFYKISYVTNTTTTNRHMSIHRMLDDIPLFDVNNNMII